MAQTSLQAPLVALAVHADTAHDPHPQEPPSPGPEPLVADSLFDAPEFLSVVFPHIVSVAMSSAPRHAGPATLPRPYLKGLQRPPRASAITG